MLRAGLEAFLGLVRRSEPDGSWRATVGQASIRRSFSLCLHGTSDAATQSLSISTDPTKILLVKGNQPLEARRHPERGLVTYASEPEILDEATDLEDGYEDLCLPPWRIAVIDTRQIQTTVTYPIPVSSPEDWSPQPWR